MQPEIAIPAAIGSTFTGILAASLDKNPVQSLVIEVSVNQLAKPISMGGKVLGHNLDGYAKSLIEPGSMVLENKYKD